jgi:fatty-acid desaturase
MNAIICNPVPQVPLSLLLHRVTASDIESVCEGEVHFDVIKLVWLLLMAAGALVGGIFTFTWLAFGVFVTITSCVLLFGHSMGSHRKLIHNSFDCPKWLEYVLVYLGVQVGLAGPVGLLRQHELRDYAQRLPTCHEYLRHGRPFLLDAWWQLSCTLKLRNPPRITLEPRIGEDRFYRFLEHTWMAQQLPPALVLYALGGWSFVFWGVCARVTAGVLGHWFIGYLAHNHGEINHVVGGAAVQGRNVRLTSLLTMGECWHNNHHAFPGSARLGLLHGEWDPGWWTLLGLSRLGLVSGLRVPADLAFRPEVVRVPRATSTRKPGAFSPHIGEQSYDR